MNKRWVIGGVVVAVLALGGGAAAVMAGRKGGDKPDAKPEDKVLDFTTKEVVVPRTQPLAGMVEFSGPLVAPNTAVVRAKAAGTLLNLTVAEGSRVTAGQKLGAVDLADLNARLNERQAQVEAARAQMVQAERTHASNQRLAEQSFISPNALESSKAALDSARANLTAAQAQTETVKINLREANLVAPISGIVAKRHVVPGEKVSNEQQIVTIVDLTKLEMAGSVGTHEVGMLQAGMPVTVQVEGVADPVKGNLARIAPAAEPGTRSIGVAIAIANPKEKLRAGQYAQAHVAMAEGTPRLTLPVAAIGTASGQEYVWTIEQGKLLRRSVTTGRRDEARGLVEVKDGVKPEAQVLAMRFDNLREGAAARVIAPVPSTAASAAKPSSALASVATASN
ncbi:MAG TPA: efflux RND transporter periplasmic adaptor subunit [Ideonella sp.]|uniref:efflux RND transporter periplasmic adaptor subunit n=1 Tax=Ideonella sp. TaxID=1929293 RepID=UPI002E37371D|nr:efflux RND transporter periplasmic adaptor subunit [Ideonella sp.]HEX5686785.1 efflux RND transporter periplasmic adaptor subunit [Ideonella sp.]